MSNDSIEDKVALARRDALSEPDRRRLEIALNTSEASRALYEAGLAFDRMHTDRERDRELLARVSARTSGRMLGGPIRKPRQLGKAAWTAGVVLLVSGAAAASLWRFEPTGRPFPTEPLMVQGSRSMPPRDRHPGAGSSASDVRAPGESSDVSKAKAPEPRTQSPAPAPPVTTPVDTPSAENAAGLFKAANDARKAGEPERALALYHGLQRRFPNAPEAQISLVLSGRLLMASGQASRALSRFDQYLKAGASGGLAEEALSGKAQALAELGRLAEERQVWRTLLRQFPKSVYARKARERLR